MSLSKFEFSNLKENVMCDEDEFIHFFMINVYAQKSGSHRIGQNTIIVKEHWV